MFNFLHNNIPQAVALNLGPVTIYWYGIFIVLGALAGIFVAIKLAKKIGFIADDVYNIAFYAVISGIIGARVYAVMLEYQYYLANPAEIIAIWHGGLAIHGAIIGGALAVIIYCYQKKQSILAWADIAAPALALAQAIGRWGNYFNQEIFGTPTNLPWGIPIQEQFRPLLYKTATHFHPTFLYESILNLVNFAILFILFFKLKNTKLRGAIFLVYLINYSLIRIAMEFLRTDSTLLLAGIRLPILVSGGLILISTMILLKMYLTVKRDKNYN